ncbi:FAD-dependent oxidoreductase [Nitrogeniibacter mangrovi]|uniref:FAD-dependent oxidoreductase n=1 Tax=Nitrogeniibacter mangrovi TaxID=2016596 RepID=A0A6C1B7P8_9RHOO|nr:FAD-dependent oxidoreductase [Nitrogeniibacter mangrovi]QID18264.1 FAD-dependent oxidoreductase [Nitrogeniibacter mangrovi]
MKRLVLLGGGHAHVHVLDALARTPLGEAVAVTLVSPYARQIYSGMLPGWIAGHYPIDACAIDLTRLTRRAGCGFRRTSAVGLDLASREVLCEDGAREAFDWLSIDVGPSTGSAGIDGTSALAVRPIEHFIDAIDRLLTRLANAPETPIALIGGGAAGVELAFALRHRCPGAAISVIGSTPEPLDGLPRRLQRHAARLMAARSIRWIGSARAVAVDAGGVTLADGARVPAADVLQVTGAAAPTWPAAAGLATDARGFIAVDATLRSRSHPFVFAAGDIASYHTPRPKSGVFAVRAGPPLAANLRRAIRGEPLAAWSPQRRALYLISSGDRHALAAWGPLAWWGDWVWRWKDRIDRRFMARFGT